MEPVATTIIGGLVVTIVGGAIIALLRRRWEIKDLKYKIREEEKKTFDAKIDKLEKAQEKQNKYLWRLGKTVVIICKILDDQTSKMHSELTSNLENIAQELLHDKPDD